MKRNPKNIVADKKAPMHLISGAAMYHEAMALGDGARKYGPFNWRQLKIEAMAYTAAAVRHIKAWEDGEDVAPDSLVHHLGHARASLGILIDAIECGAVIDDRPAPGGAPKLLAPK